MKVGEQRDVEALFEGLRANRYSRMFFSDFPWLSQVVRGDWSAIPEDLGWRSSIGLALMINGWKLWEKLGRGTFQEAQAFPFDLEARARADGRWEGSVVDLWIALFVRWRAYDHGLIPDDDDPLLNLLCRTLRERLQELPPYRDPRA